MSEEITIARLRKCIRDLRYIINEHHSDDVMKSEHTVCPVCSQQKFEDVLNEAYLLDKAGDCVPENYQTEKHKHVGSGDGLAATMRFYLNEKLYVVLIEGSWVATVRAKLPPECSTYALFRECDTGPDQRMTDTMPIKDGERFYSVPPGIIGG